MSGKLSPTLKALVAASHAKGGALPAPKNLDTLFDAVNSSAQRVGLGHQTVLTLSTAALITLNSPQSLCALFAHATKGFNLSTPTELQHSIERAAVMREAGLKCISFSGIPRAINGLGALRASLPAQVASALSTEPTRLPTPANVDHVARDQALSLWNNVYEPHSTKLLAKLAESHPDLPVHILSSHYGPLLSDPAPHAALNRGKVGRVLTSVVAIACLRAQQGVAPQVSSHVYGLKNSSLPKSGAELEEPVKGVDFLTSNEGAEWVLNEVDRIVAAITADHGTSFAGSAGARESKL